MTEKQKIDIILRGLYEFKGTKTFCAPTMFLPDLSSNDSMRIAAWLRNNGFVNSPGNSGFMMRLTSDGIMYCEDDSQSSPGSSVMAITYVQNINSPGSTIQVGIQGQVLYPNITEIQGQIDAIRKEIEGLHGISNNMVSEIGQCLDEIAAKVDDRRPVPGFVWDWLSRIDTITSLADKVQILRKFIDS